MTRKQKQFGFSLIELVVAVAMIGILSAVALTKYRTGEKSKRVQFAADMVIDSIRTAQNAAQSGVTLPASNCAQGKSARMYMVTFIANANSVLVRGIDKCFQGFTLQTSVFPQGTRIRAVNGLKVDGANKNPLTITFRPPFARIDTSGIGVPSEPHKYNVTTISITVESTDGTFARTVELDGLSGKIQ